MLVLGFPHAYTDFFYLLIMLCIWFVRGGQELPIALLLGKRGPSLLPAEVLGHGGAAQWVARRNSWWPPLQGSLANRIAVAFKHEAQ